MSEHNLVHRRFLRRNESWVKRAIWDLFIVVESPCRMLIEVFIRRDFGARYFRISTAVATFLFLSYLPSILPAFDPIVWMSSILGSGPSGEYVIKHYLGYITWYIYLTLFLVMSIRHFIAIKRGPSVLNFEKYSLDSGRVHDVFKRVDLGRSEEEKLRIIECWLEPFPFFVAGLVLQLLGQHLGWLLMFSAVTYSVSYYAAYRAGDDYVMDIIDNMIVSSLETKAFLEGGDGSETKGYRDIGRKPADPDKRRALLEYQEANKEKVQLAK